LGAQRYAIPGRTIEMWMQADKPGVYYGECNQICGQNHSKMPIAVHAVTEAEFKTWIEQAKKAAGISPPDGTQGGHDMLAAAERPGFKDVQR
jgi:cytochrome c oxidase subunit II